MIVFVNINKAEIISLLSQIENLDGLTALLILCFTYIVSNLLILPLGLPLNLMAGMLWGTIIGGLIINVLATIVAGISFYIGRLCGIHFLEGYFKTNVYLNAAKDKFNKHDWQFISLARINPIVPFGLSNYIFGVIPDISFRHYIAVTAIANLVPCLAFASIGSMLKTFTLSNGNIQKIIFRTGISILLISFLYAIKILMPNTIDETAQNEKEPV